ncbi:Na+/H+ antiporter NhaC family protein [Capnocytophaga felis]|uniref:Sodium:proton antiporter n=1 Tax=Capnocytophaga felis TaxID=2267611 RepID=A0A5M4B7Z5_9FLAO|nr:Na+/H+ antiporter NhaC family protein [Capnocytophaga felis]GET45490.1 sodium:proton antiporter [Capnocytophaga felis]GET47347.1 sodium:proton antiporter [Capnocytophaga felis]
MSLKKESGIVSVIPLLVFVIIFLGGGIYFDDFYSLPTPLVALIGVIVALLIYKAPFAEKMDVFFKGAGNNNVLTMCVIILFAGAFATVAKASGSVESIVNLGISYISPQYFPLGIFVIASFLSFSTGTSVGTITTLAPVVISLAEQSDLNASLVGACLLSGSMFGDNLSLISDTTIVATQTMGCKMDEKMKANARIAFPAAVLTVIILLFLGNSQAKEIAIETQQDVNYVLILPYLAVVVLSLLGINVFVSLLLGVFFSGTLGMIYGKFDFLEFVNHTYRGFTDMSEIFLLFFFTGGLAALVEHFGGIQFMMKFIQKRIKSPKTALLGMGTLVGTTDFCVANNTVSILIVSKISRKIANQFHLSGRDVASVLDIFSCYVQGIIPYGAQIIALIELSKGTISYPEVAGYAIYLHLLLLSALVYIFIRKYKKSDFQMSL